jgi:hypothetical protein
MLRQRMCTSTPVTERATCWFALALALAVLTAGAGCGHDDSKDVDPQLAADLAARKPFVPVYRAELRGPGLDRAGALGMPPAMAATATTPFYLAINKSELPRKWFLSAYLKEMMLGLATAGSYPRSLATRVVSFRLGSGRLYLFDVDQRKKASDLQDPEVIVDSYPVVTGYDAFERLDGSSNYVLIDPRAGESALALESATSGAISSSDRFTVEDGFASRFRTIDDGVTFERLVTGHADQVDGMTGMTRQVRAFISLGIGIRRYGEGQGFTAVTPPPVNFYFVSPPALVPNAGTTQRFVQRWNLPMGARPVRWLVNDLSGLQEDPKFAPYDFFAAIKSGVESWNEVFGYPVFVVEKAGPNDSFANDDQNFFVVEQNPRQALAVANARSNPNTGEVRGASIHFYSGWMDAALRSLLDPNAMPDPTMMPTPTMDATAPAAALSLSWEGLRNDALCTMFAPSADQVAAGVASEAAIALVSGLAPKEKVERFIAHIAAHEVGHTLGLRHNFKGSLVPPSSSVMDYLVALDQVAQVRPGAYDVAAIRNLYGMSPDLPKQPFCTDDLVGRDPLCAQRDAADDPLHKYHGPRFETLSTAYLRTGADLFPALSALSVMVGFVLQGATPVQRLEAWRIAVAPVRAPVPPQKLALDSTYGARVDRMARLLFAGLSPEPPAGTPAGATPARPVPQDAPLQTEITAELKASLLNVDGIRTLPLRRFSVDVLKRLQSLAAYRTLREARAELEAAKPALTADDQLYTDDLISRIDRATQPYFDH